jgi:hypothetical protein
MKMLKQPTIKITGQNKKYLNVTIWFRDDDWNWRKIKLKIPKRSLKC